MMPEDTQDPQILSLIIFTIVKPGEKDPYINIFTAASFSIFLLSLDFMKTWPVISEI